MGAREMATCVDHRDQTGSDTEGSLHLENAIASEEIDQVEGDRRRQEEGADEFHDEGGQQLRQPLGDDHCLTRLLGSRRMGL